MRRWSILDPNDRQNDISRGSDKAERIREIFAEAYRNLIDRMEEVKKAKNHSPRNMTILGPIVGGDYEEYVEHRDHMKNVDMDLRGSRSSAR
jgi:non-canonical poly(A) RNA polymerase PAPD5/7